MTQTTDDIETIRRLIDLCSFTTSETLLNAKFRADEAIDRIEETLKDRRAGVREEGEVMAGTQPTGFPTASRELVLDAFAVESEAARSTLERYLQLYPEYAAELVDLSRELSRQASDDVEPLSAADRALIEAAWTKHAARRGK